MDRFGSILRELLGNKRFLIISGAVIAATVLTVCIIVLCIGEEPVRKEPRVISLTIEAPDNIPLEEKERIVYESLVKAGYSSAAACGMMGNIAVESPDFDPTVINGSNGAFGLFQWTDVGNRQQKLKDFCMEHAMNYGSIEGQIAFAVYELSGADPIATRLDDFLKETDDAYAACAEFTAGFERCISDAGQSKDIYAGSLYPEFYGEHYQKLSKRINKAMNYYERFGNNADTGSEESSEVYITIE